MDEWQTLVDSFKQISNTIEINFPSIEPLAKYLDNENLLKTNLNVKAPFKNVSKDVIEFKQQFIILN